METLESISRTVNRWVEHLLFVLGASMALLVAAQVFARYVLNSSLFWSEELARLLLIWLTFLGATVAYRRQANPGVDVITSRLSDRSRRVCAVAVHLCALGLFAVMIGYGYQFAHFVRLQITPALGIPKWIPHGIIPVAGLIFAVHAVSLIGRELRRVRSP